MIVEIEWTLSTLHKDTGFFFRFCSCFSLVRDGWTSVPELISQARIQPAEAEQADWTSPDGMEGDR